MKRLAKKIFSKVTIVLLAILLQVTFWIILQYFLGSYFHISALIDLVVSILSFFIVVAVINKRQQEVFKLPWIIVVLLFPIFGVVIYALFDRNPLSKKQVKHRNDIKNEILSNIKNDEVILEELKKNSLDAYGQCKYIYNASNTPLMTNTKTEYLDSGEAFYDKLLSSMEKAEKYIMLEYFILATGKMLDGILEVIYRKIEQGVKAYIIFDDIGTMGRIKNKDIAKMRKKGINVIVFNPFVPIASVVHNNRDHRKIMVVDGKCGIMGGVNIGDEYINIDKPFGHWKDSAVYLEGDAVKSLIAIFLQNYNIFVKKENRLKLEDLIVEQKIESDGYVQPFSDGPSPIDNHHVGEEVYLNLIGQAKHKICITTPYLIVSYDFLLSLCRASERGVDVQIITPYIADKKIVNILTKSNYEMLISSGVKVYEYKPGFMHAKNFVVDEEFAVCGTINLDYRSFVHHYECGVWMYKSKAIKEMQKDFDLMIENQTIQIDEEKAKLSLFKKIIKELINLFAPLF